MEHTVCELNFKKRKEIFLISYPASSNCTEYKMKNKVEKRNGQTRQDGEQQNSEYTEYN